MAFKPGDHNTMYASYSGMFVRSSDNGETWTQKTSDATRAWTSIVFSSDGTKFAGTVQGENIYTGESTQTSVLTLETGTMDSTCTFQVISSTTATCNYIVQTGDISSDLTINSVTGNFYDALGGLTTQLTIDTNLAVNNNLVISTDGATITNITSSKANGVYTTGDVIDISVTFSRTINSDWPKRILAGSRSWTSITSSSDGVKLAAVTSSGYIYTSSDSGATWTQRTNDVARSWRSITSSSDGTKLAALGSGTYIYTSIDSGLTWTQRTSDTTRNWRYITSSSDGTKLAAGVLAGYIYTSTDSGITWIQRTSDATRGWCSITSSSDGTKLAAAADGQYIYISTDSGVTWTQSASDATRSWRSITSSSDGTKLAAVVNNGTGEYIYTSVDSGVTWTERTTSGSRNWNSITSSSDGTKLAAAASSGYVYISTDSGLTWTQKTSDTTRNWYSITSSSDGTKLAAATSSGYIYTGLNTNINTTILTFETGDTDRTCVLIASGTTTATCNYTVQPGDTSADLNVKSIVGDFYDYGGNLTTNLSIPINLSDNKDIIIHSVGPAISNIKNTSIGIDSSTIKWTTDEASSSIIEYGETTSYGTLTTEIDTPIRVTSHTIMLTGLSSCTTYHYRVKSTDSLLFTTTSTDNNFKTPGCPSGSYPKLSQSQLTLPNPTTPSCLPGHLFDTNTGKPCTTVNTNPSNGQTTPRTIKLTTPRMSGLDVKGLQTYLNTHSYNCGTPDGVFGNKTKQAVIKFQLANNLKGDGVVGKMTREKMK
jgi:hypothetical protein